MSFSKPKGQPRAIAFAVTAQVDHDHAEAARCQFEDQRPRGATEFLATASVAAMHENDGSRRGGCTPIRGDELKRFASGAELHAFVAGPRVVRRLHAPRCGEEVRDHHGKHDIDQYHHNAHPRQHDHDRHVAPVARLTAYAPAWEIGNGGRKATPLRCGLAPLISSGGRGARAIRARRRVG